MFGPLGGCTTSVVPLAETTVPLCSMPVPFWPGGGGVEAGGTALMPKTGLTVTVVPEMVTDWPASRSMSSDVEEFEMVTGDGAVAVNEVVASTGDATTGSLVVGSM